jgi:O-antigen ligase
MDAVDRSLLAAGPIVAGIVFGTAFAIYPLAVASSIAALLLAVVWPFAGLGILAFIVPLVGPPGFPAPGFSSTLIGAILVGCVYRLPIDRPHLRIGAPMMTVLAFLLYVTIQQLPEMMAGYASADDHNVGFLFFQLLAAVGVVVASAFLMHHRSPYPVLAMAIAGATLAGIISLGSYGSTTVGAPLSNLLAPSTDLGRATGPFSNPNYLGSFTAVALVASVGLLMIRPRMRDRLLLVGSGLVLTAAVALSLSRGAMVGVLVGLAVLTLARSRSKAILVVGLAAVAAFLVYPAFVQWRLQNLLGSASPEAYVIMNQSDDSRLAGILAAPRLFLSSPVTGVGFGHFVPMSVTVSDTIGPINAHNWFLTVLAEQGLVGVALVALLAITLVASMRRRPRAPRTVGYGVLGALVGVAFFLEPPTSFQMLAVPVIVLVASLTADWTVTSAAHPGSSARIGTRLRTVAQAG